MPANTCIIISGATAVGKTAIAIELAKHFNTSIISADSRQCYRETTIAVAKPGIEELESVPHYFINSHSIHDTVTAASFAQYAQEKLAGIFKFNRVAIVVGGTGLYIKALVDGLDSIPQIKPTIREAIISSYEQYGIDWLKSTVKQEDPLYFETGETENPQRLMRALEVIRSTGISIRKYQSGQKQDRNFNIIHINLELPREELVKRIDRRVDIMVREGLIKEAQVLYPFRQLNALQTVGYTELFEFFDGKISEEKAIELIKIHTRQYAKRQVTWFKKAAVDAFFSSHDLPKLIEFVEQELQAADSKFDS